MKKELTITTVLRPDSSNTVVVSIQNTDGEVITKNVAFDDYLKMLDDSTVSTHVGTRLHLPENCYDIKCADSQNFSIILTVPAQLFPITYLRDNHYVIPFPRLLFAFNVVDTKLVESRVFAIPGDSSIDDDTIVYHYPFGNVYESGRICWGSNSLPDVDDPGDCRVITQLFFSAPTNDDLWKTSCISSSDAFLSQLYNRLNGVDKFDDTILKPTSYRVGNLF